MEEIIGEKLKEIEKQHDVRVLLAVESGSRAWGFASASSDYDVRFIYIHRPEWYLSIDSQGTGSKRDVIEYPINKKVDINGWELTKALRLFRKSNPTVLEWLRSEFIYFHREAFVERLHVLETEVFNLIPSVHHYFNLAKGNYKKYFQGEEIKIKICLYVVKSLLACIWIKKNKSFPPVRIQDLFGMADEILKLEMEQLVSLKLLGEDTVSISEYHTTREFIETNLKSIQQILATQKVEQHNVTAQLDQLFRDVLANVWSAKAFK